jgi:ATP-binding cassette, subfamily C (CFTR/MRP), member 10
MYLSRKSKVRVAQNFEIIFFQIQIFRDFLDLRQKEVVFLSKRKYLDALCVYFWATTPVLMCLLTFGVSVLLGQPLTAATTFTSVALLNMLIGPLNAFPWVLNGLIEAWVSLKRVQNLIDLDDIDYAAFYSPMSVDQSMSERDTKPVVVSLDNASFEYEKVCDQIADEFADFQLRTVSLEILAGDLVCFEGPVGGGKSTLLLALTGNLKCISGNIAIENGNKGFGYVSQQIWLQRGTIRDNVTWGSIYDEVRYKNVLHACALEEDLVALGGDRRGIGEAGHTLSGGQKARVALARAIYQDKEGA